jgi:hypothetical protein
MEQFTYGGSSYNSAGKLIKINNDYILAGESDSDSSGVKTEDSRGGRDFWFLKIDSAFQVIYDKTLGGSSNGDLFRDIIYDNTIDKLFISGISASDISGDITQGPYGFNDYLLFCCHADNGQVLSDHRYGGSSDVISINNGVKKIILNKNIYFGGESNSDSSGVKTEDSRDGGLYMDFWILKLNKDGSIVWDKTIGGNHVDNLFHMEATDDNQILLIGSSSSTIGWEKSENQIGQLDYWVVSIDTNANILWQKTLGGTLTDRPKQVIVLGTNHYILFGDSNSGVSGHKTEPCRGDEDLWILEISTNLSIENFSKNKLNITPNPTSDYFSFSFPEQSTSGIIYIFDSSGSIILSEFIENSQNTIQVSNLSQGLYFVSFFDENKIGYSSKLIIE